jgi:hypothetical protein
MGRVFSPAKAPFHERETGLHEHHEGDQRQTMLMENGLSRSSRTNSRASSPAGHHSHGTIAEWSGTEPRRIRQRASSDQDSLSRREEGPPAASSVLSRWLQRLSPLPSSLLFCCRLFGCRSGLRVLASSFFLSLGGCQFTAEVTTSARSRGATPLCRSIDFHLTSALVRTRGREPAKASSAG